MTSPSDILKTIALGASFVLFLALLVPESAATLAGRTIAIDPGHGHNVNWGSGMPIAEGTWVLDAGLRAQTHLQNHGATVVMTRTTGANPALSTRVSIANSNNAHRFVSIHSNAAGASANGMEAIWCNQNPNPSASQALANRLRVRSLNMVHNANRGNKECLDVGRGFHFYVIRGTLNMPGALPEYYFHTNLWENTNIHASPTGRENVARSLYAAICDVYGVTPNFEEPPPPSTTFSAGDWVRSTADPNLNLRAGPGTNHDIIRGLPLHTVAQVLPHANNGIRATNNNWWHVQVHPTGEIGWLAEVFLEATSAPGDAHVEIIVDNSDPGFSASANWQTATWADDKYGADYRFRDVAPVSDRASWTANIPYAGTYQVYAWWNEGSNRSQDAPYTVEHAGGDSVVRVNQRQNGGRWNLLGTYNFNAGEARVLLSCWTSNSGNDIVIADAVRFVTFEEPPAPDFYALNVTVNGQGSVQRSPNASEYEDGTQVQLTAIPAANHFFSHWSGDLEGSTNPMTMTMQSPRNVTAHFSLNTYVLTTSITGPGEVQRSPDFVEYDHGASVNLLAVPEDGFDFAGWSGAVQSSENPVSITINGPVTVTAAFERTYQAWTRSHFTEAERADDSISGDLANPSGDRIPNLLKYALGLDPRVAEAGALPFPEVRPVSEAGDEKFLTLTFSHPTGLDDIEYTVRLSNDLSDWSESATLVSSDENNGTTTRTYRDNAPYDIANRRFMRLEIQR